VPAGRGSYALDLSGLPTGVYVVQVRLASGEQVVRQVVRQ